MNAHRPVMLEAALAGLAVREGGIYVDATYGRGGHSGAILDLLHGTGTLHAFDQDPQACDQARQQFGSRANFRIHAANFARMAEVARDEGWLGQAQGVLFDLGVSSPQLDDAARGFSFLRDGPLDMRMNPQVGEPASAWLARASEAELADVLWRLGEERHSRRIARAIVAARAESPLETTRQLAELVARVMPGPRQKIHPATRTFQAIRLHINRELEVLSDALGQAVEVLAPGGRLVAISFHSLEDRIVKRFIRAGAVAAVDAAQPAGSMATPHGRSMPAALKAVARHFPTADEIEVNPRARSAVLRVAEKRPAEATP
jgi:16S rRNA (cytosine1402-N4)-methyltransferase